MSNGSLISDEVLPIIFFSIDLIATIEMIEMYDNFSRVCIRCCRRIGVY